MVPWDCMDAQSGVNFVPSANIRCSLFQHGGRRAVQQDPGERRPSFHWERWNMTSLILKLWKIFSFFSIFVSWLSFFLGIFLWFYLWWLLLLLLFIPLCVKSDFENQELWELANFRQNVEGLKNDLSTNLLSFFISVPPECLFLCSLVSCQTTSAMISAAPAEISLCLSLKQHHCTATLLGHECNEQITSDATSLIQGF